ncbi:MAG: arginine--tRNA ligase [Chlamydiae bacterium RIFCSPHIGHO2_12_FULL_27_8]|nr:MAG: arginine--tRNA ligase [Chlamydiae bacterium RIFCSPHIGHO2_12_FULL_27_8]OGN65305.1 MAG: arginine--tRNA ligase [Chlamydiae bacterium RIFCSPLOWO2_01_FULL_28_7]
MDTLFIEFLQNRLTRAILKAFDEKISLEDANADVALTLNESFGHYQCNNALKLSKILKENPKKIADKIIFNLNSKEDLKELFSKVEIAGPGFINITISSEYISEILNKNILDKKLGIKKIIPQKIIVEFSSPNIAKELHVGHLRSTIIGDSLARLFEFLGHDVLRLNHIGDWGTQFGMLISFLKKYHKDVLDDSKKIDLTTLTLWYKQARKLFDSDEQFKKDSQKEVVNLQSGEKNALKAWNAICDISRTAFQEIYKLLDIKLNDRGESFYNSELQNIVNDLEKKGLIEISDRAKCVFLEGYQNREGNPLPVMVQKSDGGFNYDTTDIAAFKHRCEIEKADRIIVVTDAGQALHFQMIYDLVVKAKYLDPNKTKFDHVTFGVVLGEDKKKFKTREGETTKLIDLLFAAVESAKDVLKSRLELDEKQLNEEAIKLGISAIKYSDLSNHRIKDYVFSYDKMLSLEGNTAAFLFYSYVRILSVKRKSSYNIAELLTNDKIELKHPSEISLGFHLFRFAEVLDIMSRDLLPNRLTDYLYDLATKFNCFFRDCQIIGSLEEKPRLLLSHLTEKILKQGFDILGLSPLNKM